MAHACTTPSHGNTQQSYTHIPRSYRPKLHVRRFDKTGSQSPVLPCTAALLRMDALAPLTRPQLQSQGDKPARHFADSNGIAACTSPTLTPTSSQQVKGRKPCDLKIGQLQAQKAIGKNQHPASVTCHHVHLHNGAPPLCGSHTGSPKLCTDEVFPPNTPPALL